ncbi:uncharacterized protein JCM6883_000931 [Sporobolomyces salmoneus]|uniref:uncharacterized protein n=1 Tax=Sporobolomyces salmoneus TaxID=183962 RepID=UPI00317B5035
MLNLQVLITAALIGTTLVSAIPTSTPNKRLTFKDRQFQSKVTNTTTSTCNPSFGDETLYNIFARGNDSAVWEWVPDFYSGNDSSGGTVFVSGTDTPQDGAYYFLPATLPSSADNSTTSAGNSTSTTTAYRLNLADKPKGQHCIVAKNGRTLTTGSCENDDSIFIISCSTCSSAPSNCRIRATVPAISSAYCTSWRAGAATIPGVPGYGAVGLRSCKDGAKGQEWDIKVAQQQ